MFNLIIPGNLSHIIEPKYCNIGTCLTFLEEFSTHLQSVKILNKSFYMYGDYNIDLLKVKTNSQFGEFFDRIISSGFYRKITAGILNSINYSMDGLYKHFLKQTLALMGTRLQKPIPSVAEKVPKWCLRGEPCIEKMLNKLGHLSN